MRSVSPQRHRTNKAEPQSDLVGAFDAIASHMVLNDVPHCGGFVRTLAASLKPGGRAVLSMNNPYSYVIRKQVPDYFESGYSAQYRGMAAAGLKVYFYHRTLQDYVTAFRQAGFNTVMWYDAGKLDLADKYGLKLLCLPPADLIDWAREHPATWGYYVADEPPPSQYSEVASKVKPYHQNDPNHPAYVNTTGHTAQSFIEALQPRVLSYTGIYRWWWYNTPYYKSMEACRSAGLAAGIPVIRMKMARLYAFQFVAQDGQSG